MPPAIKKRKVAAATSKVSKAPALQHSIHAFGKISKSQRPTLGKSTPGTEGGSGKNQGEVFPVGINPKKRKLESVEEVALGVESDEICVIPLQTCDDEVPIATSTVHLPSPPVSSPSIEPLTPRKVRKGAVRRSQTTDTPTKGARSCLESLALQSFSPKNPNAPSTLKWAATPPSSPAVSSESPNPSRKASQEFPDECQDLINLHSSFLTALSLHYAHHGCLTPADLRILKPSIERSWRKRAVSTDDVRRILAIQQRPGTDVATTNLTRHTGTLSLSDYGLGKICVEIADSATHHGIQRRPINEETLNASFATNLSQQWTSYTTTTPSPSPKTFISLLPLHPITLCSSLSKTTPLLAKGQLRLSDLKAQQPPQKPNNPLISNPSAKVQPTSRSSNLLTRILAKQQHASSLPPPPTPDLLLRKSALQRLPEIIPVLEILTTSASRSLFRFNRPADSEPNVSEQQSYSFTMPTLVQHLQMSLRNPISKEDAVRCVRLLGEVVPEWVSVREVGRVVGVRVRKGGRVGREEMGRRIGGLLEGL